MLKKDKSELTDIEYIVTQENGTEPPLWMNIGIILLKEFM